MAEGSSYPVRLVNSDDKTTAGTTLVFTDQSNQPDTAQVYVQTSDPGAVGAGAIWVNTTSISGTSQRPILVRNAANDAWIPIGDVLYASAVNRGGLTVANDGGVEVNSRNGSGVIQTYLFLSNTTGSLVTKGLLTLDAGAGNIIRLQRAAQGTAAANANQLPILSQVSPLFSVTSGALTTQQLVSTTGAQVSTSQDVETYTPFTTDGTNNIASCTVALSSDNVTYSTIFVPQASAAVNFVGAVVIPITVRVPAGWYIKMTSVHGTIGVTTYA